jgi:hypothetical protein
VTLLEELLEQGRPRDHARVVEQLYRFLPRSLARLTERALRPRHLRSLAPRISFARADEGGWAVRQGMDVIARSQPFHELLGRVDRPVTIVATGPSARDYDWSALRGGNRYLIAVAGAPTLLKEMSLRPDLLVVSDSRFARYGLAHLRNAPGVPLLTVPRAVSILAAESPDELTSRPFAMIEKINSWLDLPQLETLRLCELNSASGTPFHFAEPFDPAYRIGWSDRPDLGFFTGSTVAFVALQIAVSLGARDIEIVGMDLSGNGRAYDEGGQPIKNTLGPNYEPVILPAFALMHQVLKERPVKLHNLSPVCPLPREFFHNNGPSGGA